MTRISVSPGFSLNVEVAGSGPPLVLLHGFTGSAESWGEFARILQRHFTTVAVDIVGHGRSDCPEAPGHYRMPQVIDDLVAAVRRSGWSRAHWLGYSMGGRTALHVAVAHPGTVERLVVIGGSAGLAGADDRAARRAADAALAERIEREGIMSFVDYWESLPLFASQRRLPAEVQARIRAGRLACSPTGLANSLRGMGAGAQEPLHHRLASLRLNALLIAGGADEKFTLIAREMAAVMPHAILAIVPGAGHAAHIEEPETSARKVRAFLEDHHPEGAPK